MAWIKALHIISMVCWFAGLFYLPRLFVYHAMSEDEISIERFKIMERKLYYGIMSPSMAATFVFGIILLWSGFSVYKTQAWMMLKLLLVFILMGYHSACKKHLKQFAADQNQKGHVYFRWFNEFPVVLLIAIVILVVVKPSF
jgi:putative membrane protein